MAFATPDDIAARLGRALGANEEAPVDLLLDLATGGIKSCADKPDSWVPDPVPTILRLICIELTVRALANPQHLASMREGLGAHHFNVTFRDVGILPTEEEELRIRRAVYGANAASSRANDLANHIGIDSWPQFWGDIDIDEDVIAS